MKVSRTSFHTIAMAIVALLAAACSDDKSDLGTNVMPEHDRVTTDQVLFKAQSKTMFTGATTARTNSSLIGCIIDPETQVKTTNDFLAQFYVSETFRLPAQELMLKNLSGEVYADSCILSIYHDKYFGDSLTTMKLEAAEIDTERTPDEKRDYSTDLDINYFLKKASAERSTATYTVIDQTLSAAKTDNKRNYRRIAIPLSPEYGSYLLKSYYSHPEYFKNSYEFSHHVCGGFLFRHIGGVGAMVQSDFVTMDLYFRYHGKTSTGNDTIYKGTQRFTATNEIIQLPHVDNEIPQELLAQDLSYTYVKSPNGLHTEITLPIAEMTEGKHYNDTINSARLSLRVYQDNTSLGIPLPKPEYLLLVRANQRTDFFKKNTLPDGQTSFITSYNAIKTGGKSTNAYTYSNIGSLISYLRAERDRGAGILPNDTEAERKNKWQRWEAQHPDWNKIVLIPATGEYTKIKNNITNRTERSLVRIRNAYDPYSVKLEGGKDHDIDISVIYSRFKN